MSSEKAKLSYNVSSETKEKIEKLAKLLDKKQGAVVDEIIADYTKDKVLSDDYYYHMKPYSFNRKDLIKNGATEGYENKKPPKTNNKDIIIVKHIPTTFDEFNKEFKTYCYDNKPLHKGVITTDKIQYGKLVLLVITTNLKEKEMNIELYNDLDELYLIKDLINHKKRKEIEKRLKAKYDYYNNRFAKTIPKLMNWCSGDYGCLEDYKFTTELLYGIQKLEDIINDKD